ncbi:sodium-dependent transporter [Fulvivirga lutea]|nr:sodium-dependent transporter [Fulvivirga lutea]
MRSSFSNNLGFIAAAAGSAVGLGNIWKFPFEVGESGGAAFLLIYLVFCFILCFPMLVIEIAMGRKSQQSAVGTFRVLGSKKSSLIGLLAIIACVLILSFYNVVAGWALGYFIEMVQGNFSIGSTFPDYIKSIETVGSFSLVFMLITAFIVNRGVSKGIETFSKWLMPILILIIVSLAIYAITLPGSAQGIDFYLIPDFSKINLHTIYNALGHAFFSLSLGMGILITYGSYLNKKENLLGIAAAITLTDVGVAFLSGLMLFPLVFSQGLETSGGAGLVFMTLPGVFEQLGQAGIFVGSLFFLLLSFAALTSTVSLFEVPVSFLIDEFKMKRRYVVWLCAFVILLIGIPSMLANGYSDSFTQFIFYPKSTEAVDFMTFISDLSSNTLLPLGGIFTCLFAAHIWRKEKLSSELLSKDKMLYERIIIRYISIAIKVICPVILGCILILGILDKYFGMMIL